MSDEKGKGKEEASTSTEKVVEVASEQPKKNRQYLDELQYEFVKEDHEQELTCPICTFLCLDPVIISTCGHYHCREHILKTDGLCSVCRGPWSKETLLELDPIKDRAVRNIFSRELVRCNACRKVLERGLKGELFAKHFNEDCPISCPKGCKDVQLTRSTLNEHLAVCPFVTVKCAAVDIGCEIETERKDIEAHQKSCTRFHLAQLFREQRDRITQLENTVARLSRKQPCITMIPTNKVEDNTLMLSENPQNVEGFVFNDNRTLRFIEEGRYRFNIHLLADKGASLCPYIELAGVSMHYFYSSDPVWGNAVLDIEIDVQANSTFRVRTQNGHSSMYTTHHFIQITRIRDL
jgi:hypothetical protein